MSRKVKIENFDPNGIGLRNGHFIGLPFSEEEASMVMLSVPWDVTVSYQAGTSTGGDNILSVSTQLDLYDAEVKNAWKMGLYLRPSNATWLRKNNSLRGKSNVLIEEMELGEVMAESPHLQDLQAEINEACEELRQWVFDESQQLLQQNKLVGIIGGEHSVPLGFLEALAAKYEDFGVLQIDAHMDLREAYEGFTHSHASIFYNALKIPQLSKLVQVGIRDYCEEEVNRVAASEKRIVVFYDADIRQAQFEGFNFHITCQRIVAELPMNVYISFDIDGLDPKLCPNTGTPVPGGLEFSEAMYLIKMVVDSGRKIIGFDLSEVAGLGNEWDGNVGARVAYRLANFMGKSHGLEKENE